MALEGAKVAIGDLEDAEPVVRAIRDAGGEAISQRCDVSDPAAVASLVSATEKTFGGVHILVNNAVAFAKFTIVAAEDISFADWDLAFAVNVRGSFICSRAVLPIMRRQNYGKIINITSATVFQGVPMKAHYVSTKGAIIAMTRALATEWGPHGIRVNAIAPGLTTTDYFRTRNDIGESLNRMAMRRAIQREEVPEDLVGTCIFFASADSDFITGQTLVVDGGNVKH
jgi:NAD(P)-dependent dehydrogenase (short-subunit alcohol dehydrogenase family)